MRKHEEALQDFDKALESSPDGENFAALRWRGEVLAKLDRYISFKSFFIYLFFIPSFLLIYSSPSESLPFHSFTCTAAYSNIYLETKKRSTI